MCHSVTPAVQAADDASMRRLDGCLLHKRLGWTQGSITQLTGVSRHECTPTRPLSWLMGLN